MILLFVITTVGTFIALLAAEFGATGVNGTAHYLISGSTRAATAVILLSAASGLFVFLSMLWWVVGSIF